MAIATGQVALAADVNALAKLTVSETEVFSGASPTSWTDLDLSGTVGAKVCLVLLKVANSVVAIGTVAFRKNGDTDEHYNAAQATEAAGCSQFCNDSTTGLYLVVLVATDALGKVEWITEATKTCTIDIIAYVAAAG